ncbi:MAG: hypothetical protein ACYTHJ_17745 [Planctomycetota bacterium]|jgi:hypothetical protein
MIFHTASHNLFVLVAILVAQPAGAGQEPAGESPFKIEAPATGYLVYIDHQGPYWTVGQKLEEVRQYAAKHDLQGRLFVRYLDDPSRSGRTRLPMAIGIVVDEAHSPQPPFKTRKESTERRAVLDTRQSQLRLIPACLALKSHDLGGEYEALEVFTEYFEVSGNDGQTVAHSTVEMLITEQKEEPPPVAVRIERPARQEQETTPKPTATDDGRSEGQPKTVRRAITLRNPQRVAPAQAVPVRDDEKDKPVEDPPEYHDPEGHNDVVEVAPADETPSKDPVEAPVEAPPGSQPQSPAQLPVEADQDQPESQRPVDARAPGQTEGSSPPAAARETPAARQTPPPAEQPPRHDTLRSDKPVNVRMKSLDLYEQTEDQKLAQRLIPKASEIPPGMEVWLGQFVLRVNAIGKGVARMPGDPASITGLIEALKVRYDFVSARLKSDPLAESVARVKNERASRERSFRAVMRDLDRLMAMVAAKSLTISETESRLRGIMRKAADLIQPPTGEGSERP